MNAETEIDTSRVHVLGEEISAALVSALGEIGAASKDKTNPHFKSKYADIGSVIEAIKPVLNKHGLGFTQHPQPSDTGILVETMLHHTSGDCLSLGTLYVPANKLDPQAFGSALTYARRYALMTAFGVPAEDDDGNAASKASNNHQARQAEARDAPFPQGPAKNKTELKDMGRELWSDVMACEDKSALDALLISHQPLIDQLKAALPQWWGGGVRPVDGGGEEPYEGLGQVIERLQRDFDAIEEANQPNLLAAG